MSATPSNVIRFPVEQRHTVRGCPHCGKRNDVWQIGRILWAFCETHEVRWVVASYGTVSKATTAIAVNRMPAMRSSKERVR
jgi:hypothetical protein